MCISRVNRTRVQGWRQKGHSHGSDVAAATTEVEEEDDEETDEAAVAAEEAVEEEDEDGAVVAGVAVAAGVEEEEGTSFFFFFTNSFSLSEHVAHICSECGQDAMVWCSMGDTHIRQSGWTDGEALVGEGCAVYGAGAAAFECDGSMLAADEGGSMGVGRLGVRSRGR